MWKVKFWNWGGFIIKRLILVVISLALLLGGTYYYFTNLDSKYYALHEFYDFPIPKDAKIESESPKVIGYKWEKSTGTEVPLNYRLMIKKAGWKKVEMDGANVVYKKNEKLINITLAPNYIDVMKLEHSEK